MRSRQTENTKVVPRLGAAVSNLGDHRIPAEYRLDRRTEVRLGRQTAAHDLRKLGRIVPATERPGPQRSGGSTIRATVNKCHGTNPERACTYRSARSCSSYLPRRIFSISAAWLDASNGRTNVHISYSTARSSAIRCQSVTLAPRVAHALGHPPTNRTAHLTPASRYPVPAPTRPPRCP